VSEPLTSKELVHKEGSALMAELFNRCPIENLKAVPQEIAIRIGNFLVANGYRIVFNRWYLQADPVGAADEPTSVDAEALLNDYDECWIEDEKLMLREDGPTRQKAKEMRERFNKARAAVLAAMRPAEPPSSWQPIETAPKDEKDFLGWECGSVAVYYRTADTPEDAAISSGTACYPTHWMPLPDAPTSVTKSEVQS
jgi:hypothetical protein